MSVLSLCLLVSAMPADPLVVTSTEDGRSIEASLVVSAEDAAFLEGEQIDSRAARRLLRLVVVGTDGRHGPPLFARYRLEGGRLVLVPRHPLLPDVAYAVVATGPDGSEIERTQTVPPIPAAKPARVTAIFPSADELPANCMKFYVHFSRPMREGRAIFDRVRIVDSRGNEVVDPWRRTELWDEEARRLTLWIHPGRVKRGVNLREEFGPVLHPDREYRLVVTRDVRAADGTRIAQAFEKSFRTTAEDRTRPRPEVWRLCRPRSGTRDPLRVTLDEPCDRALLERMIELWAGGSVVPASIRVGEGERAFDLVPERPWQPIEYALHVDGDLEDLAGNSPRRVFDTDLDDRPPEAPVLVRTFRAR